MALTFNAFYLGHPGITLDPTEGNTTAENASLFVGQTYGSPGNALANDVVSFTSVNRGGNATALDQDNSVVNDRATTNVTGSNVTYTFDGTAVYNATITYTDGTTSASVPVVIVQMTNGDLYLVPSPTAGTPTNIALTAHPIRSIKLNSLVGNNYSGMTSDRPVLTFPTCFTRGTLISTPKGPIPVEDLAAGDLVQTLDHGTCAIRWVGMRRFTQAELETSERLRPIRIPQGALGSGLPLRDLVVSPQHRVLVRSRLAERMFDTSEVLVAAKHLVGVGGIAALAAAGGVEYWHLLFDRHEIVLSEGAATESLYTGAQAMGALAADQRAEIMEIFPELADARIAALTPPARPLISGRRAERLVQRHAQNHRALFMVERLILAA